MGVGGKQRDEAQRAKDVGDREQRLCQQSGVPEMPVVSGYIGLIKIVLLEKKRMTLKSVLFAIPHFSSTNKKKFEKKKQKRFLNCSKNFIQLCCDLFFLT